MKSIAVAIGAGHQAGKQYGGEHRFLFVRDDLTLVSLVTD
jgi:hypothetical protein